MSVLLPDLERQLRAAIRSEVATPRRRPLGGVALVAAVLVTAAVVVGALQLRAVQRTAPAPATAFGLAVQTPEQLLPTTLQPGQYWYERAVEVKPAVEVVRYGGRLLQLPETRHSLYESWIGTDLRSTAHEVEIGTPEFPNGHDRALWLASGSPTAPPFDYSAARTLPWLSGGYAKLRDLPTRPIALLHLARQAAARTLSPAHRDRPVAPELVTRVEFNELASLLHSPTTIGTHRGLLDLIGRRGTSLTLLDDTIIYDPATGAVLGEQFGGPQPLQLRLAYIASGVVQTRGGLPPGISEVQRGHGSLNRR
jgi:hypothetical protein